MKCAILAAMFAVAMARPDHPPHQHMFPLLPTNPPLMPHLTQLNTLLRNSPLNPSPTNTVLPMTTPAPTTRRPKPKVPMETSKVHTVSTFPTAAFKSSPTLLTTPTDSLLMSDTKELPNTPR